jgi:hypothetical protein
MVIEAEPAVCFEAITDYSTFPEWQSAVKEVDVLSHHDQGRGRDVRFSIDTKIRQVMKRSVEDLQRRVEDDS